MKIEEIEKNPILKQTFEFSIDVIKYCAELDLLKHYVISKQLLRSATSIGANAFEAQNAESKADFIHKFKIAAKEANETQYWLLLCQKSFLLPSCESLLEKLEVINRIINTIISSSKTKNI
jgi:four helix bundle protein